MRAKMSCGNVSSEFISNQTCVMIRPMESSEGVRLIFTSYDNDPIGSVGRIEIYLTDSEFEGLVKGIKKAIDIDEYREHNGLNEPTESTTPALDRCKEAGYKQCTDGTCTCLDCKYSRTAKYVGGVTKFVCDKLNIQTYKCAYCKHFKLKKEGVSNESICRD